MSRADNQHQLQDKETALSFGRIAELQLRPVAGKFDIAHLQEIHRRIFQDLPELKPGAFRQDDTYKNRALETINMRYIVPYASVSEAREKLASTLDLADPIQGTGP